MAAVNFWSIEAAMGHQHSLEDGWEVSNTSGRNTSRESENTTSGNEADRLVETSLE